ncbi:hypothetical protein [Streptosporangium lutulentum]|uniref:MarR family transcriptional regulator n=1 Tax=Streptosporangium lutulentum TaxID=1461250 RepID=A0ABT9QNI0_9ACTN|nr:hypothetical protein [Streptosporangium lutulentum]MDP9848287.1 hypothetical protein [Streptosporangium lutulentum]
MSDKKLSIPEISALVVLMVEAKEVSNPELKEHHGLTLDGKARRHLNELKLVDSWKDGRAYAHVLTDLGWARMAEELHAGTVPLLPGSAGAMARALLIGLQGFMKRTDHRLADIFQPRNDSDAGDSSVPAAESEVEVSTPAAVAASPAPAATSTPDIEARVRAAYTELAREPGTWVSLTKIRPLLGDATRAEVDDVLTLMNRMPGVNIVPESNQKTLTQQDRDAAVTIGDQAKHFLSIEVR